MQGRGGTKRELCMYQGCEAEQIMDVLFTNSWKFMGLQYSEVGNFAKYEQDMGYRNEFTFSIDTKV